MTVRRPPRVKWLRFCFSQSDIWLYVKWFLDRIRQSHSLNWVNDHQSSNIHRTLLKPFNFDSKWPSNDFISSKTITNVTLCKWWLWWTNRFCLQMCLRIFICKRYACKESWHDNRLFDQNSSRWRQFLIILLGYPQIKCDNDANSARCDCVKLSQFNNRFPFMSPFSGLFETHTLTALMRVKILCYFALHNYES